MKNRKNILLQISLFFTILFFTAFFINAGPVIEVDNAHINAGSIRKGERKIVRHMFKIKNTGDETLRISRVKPG